MSDTLIAGGRELTGEIRPVEARAEIEPLEVLHAERRALIPERKKLHALHGKGGKWEAKRKALLEAMKIRARMDLITKGEKFTEAYIDTLGHADEQYIAFIDEGVSGAARLVELDTLIAELEERIMSRNTELSVYGKEVTLR